MENFFLGLGDVFNLTSLAFMLFGVVCGIVVGAIPGLSGPMAIALCIPLTYYMTPVGAVGFLVGINKGGTFGGSIASILLNTPGSPESAATCYDGYPLALQRKGEKALKVSLFASFFGDTISAVSLVLLSVPLASVALKLAPADICAIILFSLVLVSGLDTGSMSKGLVAGALGMLLGCVGLDPVSGQPRLDFGVLELSAGIPLMCLAIGTLAMSEIIFQMQKSCLLEKSGAELARTASREEGRVSWAELKSVIRTAIRSSGIGVVIGVLPGLGATLAAFLSYSEARRWSKTPENFGKGEISGVVASETGNNAATGGAMIPMLALGLPGGSTTALMLSVFMLHGLEPGPLIMVEQEGMVWSVFTSMLLANCCILFLGYVTMRIVVNLLRIPNNYLMPIVFVLATIGAYALRNSTFDVVIMLAAGIAGFFLRRRGYSPASIVLGSILGSLGESALAKSMQLSTYDWTIFFSRPFAAFFMISGIIAILLTIWRGIREVVQRRNADLPQ